MDTYVVGQEIELLVSFTDDDGNPVDPDTVVCYVQTPDLAAPSQVEPVIRDSAGSYSAAYTVEQNGLHSYRFLGEGAHPSPAEGSFMGQTVFPIPTPPVP